MKKQAELLWQRIIEKGSNYASNFKQSLNFRSNASDSPTNSGIATSN